MNSLCRMTQATIAQYEATVTGCACVFVRVCDL